MIGLLAMSRFFGRLPRPIWFAIAAVAALMLVWRWHDRRVDAAYGAGAAAQARIDTDRFQKAAIAAEKAQQGVRDALALRQAKITKGTENALSAQNADLARRYDDLRLRWAAYRADPGRAGQGGATGLPRATGGADDAGCAASGWVSFDTAATAAQAADVAIARDDAWRAWVTAQRAAWPD